MTERLTHARILIYSHDSFGLGHLRRSRAIAHALVDQFKGLRVLILSGSPIIGRFDFKARVDFVRVPGIIKLRNGDYTSLDDHINLTETLEMRGAIIQQAAETFAPDIFLVDKEPLGIRGEVEKTLEMTRKLGATNIVGLRDIMDDAESLRAEWQRKRVIPALEALYDEIWIYGLQQMGNPLSAVRAPKTVLQKAVFTGYLPRSLPDKGVLSKTPNEAYILVTTGGGGDGVEVIDWVLRAYEQVSVELPFALVVLGPFMPQEYRQQFLDRVLKIEKLEAITFDSHMELLMNQATAVVAMGGYNTFCEILSFDKPALLLPRATPRQEQLIRAKMAQSLGLINMLNASGQRSTESMISALSKLTTQTPPSRAGIKNMLDGYNTIGTRLRDLIT